ncbi:MAG TPA: hypothetical protein VKI00_24980 [Mycobacterium sp.]|uniref:hypothetical protein n=1 Tax=Mycobacterium sp. TaxID=1785 RepID=UPI002C1A3039|nr:hypothetical protein [Mycobacterium sp.]HME78785.1 hypothetical protein [Mycobacterium sp.]
MLIMGLHLLVAKPMVWGSLECYPSQSGRDWFDDEVFLGLMRVRGVQCRSRYAEAFTVEKAVLETDSYSVN